MKKPKYVLVLLSLVVLVASSFLFYNKKNVTSFDYIIIVDSITNEPLKCDKDENCLGVLTTKLLNECSNLPKFEPKHKAKKGIMNVNL